MNNGWKISIVIPVYKNADLIQNLLKDLHKWEKDSIDEICIVDDASYDAELDGVLEFWMQYWNVFTILENERNLGFTLSSNKGLEEVTNVAEKRIVFLISSDVRINGRFINQAVGILDSARRHFVGHKLLSGNTGWNMFDGKIFEYLEGYFLAATGDGWIDLGFFDPNYAPNDFEDVDISTNAKNRGYKLVALNNPVINHLGGRSIGYSKEREAITNRNREYFKWKWLGE